MTDESRVAPYRLPELVRQIRDDALVVACREPWATALVVLGWVHLGVFSICHVMDQIPAPDLLFLIIWLGDFVLNLVLLRAILGRGWAYRTALAGLILRIYITLAILMFGAVMQNTLTGIDPTDNWYKLAWVGLSTFALMIMSYLTTARFFAGAVVLFLTGLAMTRWPAGSFLLFGLGWWAVLQASGLALIRAKQKISPEQRPETTIEESDPLEQPQADPVSLSTI